MSINFSPEGQDTNDAKELATALSKIKVGIPSTFGGVMHSEDNANVVFDTFNIHAPPDITPNTRIIAVLGIPQEDSTKRANEWFISDFFAFWNLFQGVTIRPQHWLHCLDFEQLVQGEKVYLHGNPYKERKVVLDHKILQKAYQGKDAIRQVPPSQPHMLLKEFKDTVKAECKSAAATGHNVLLLMFGHGDPDNYGIHLGGKSTLFTPKLLKFLLKGISVSVTMLTTQCFGGGWSCSPHVNLTTMTAAGTTKDSKSWRYSGSTGRACGSMFATAIINKLIEHPATGDPLGTEDDEGNGGPADWTKDQHESYASFSQAVYESLLRGVDRRGLEHHITFSAQDDAWSMCWGPRTGIPLENFRQRWQELPTFPADKTLHPGDPFNRDPLVTDAQRQEYQDLWKAEKARRLAEPTVIMPSAPSESTGSILGKRKMSGCYGGTLDGLIRTVKTLAGDYLRSNPGMDDSSLSGALHYDIGKILADQEKDQSVVEETLRIIQYRMEHQSTADRYLELMNIPAPHDTKCCEFDTRFLIDEVPDPKYEAIKDMIYDGHLLFPHPEKGQGHAFTKGIEYLIIAFHVAKSDQEVVMEKLQALKAQVEAEVEQNKTFVKRDPEVARKRHKVFKAFGLGIMSPRKRQSVEP
ncbi:MAG: hypothetical protein L6R40_000548 [Gallowayella cf. fulva]|nr:MAG: hypothetical protein L6R40_000548 [Xanthomendoza cf. fulva]